MEDIVYAVYHIFQITSNVAHEREIIHIIHKCKSKKNLPTGINMIGIHLI